ncbi:50S ribosomal protein L16 [Candidatus Marsarchaeota G2 archaeon ECH_B_SAG-F08]|jgi:LSU ribosomal protein L10AE|uniref:Large ribosomal subunit protein uL16 n=5 Tax=Candidatus Marsarchaeota TaxID=1978152 RepID=A0A2R6AKK8_9ARCH|nr:MAG: 50S ribosomal protein L16 [Candidatus Marsarchaeota G1 archaeon OSP_D]PSN86912.1 MAG: 50S ribosomal protein L16 [Candidatus Marsarchaeota G1 archaeon BE_D]PSN89572.1 MAG: 50S ribosomal protein L16 [Candidatus Marsarchaeota G1 archaeon OSP_C]PSN98933.1 MAG: 50S ribosomal protein L16 [Candidatus Marsarchaeota G2 archaeon ECH_B_SAG-F08]PSO03634.1 MAG: 50S ribosomal protein L16 [Candidatus Marsarchaeota G2 archaeon ECH_B_SAG-E12]
MPLRPARCYRRIDTPPYTRKEYIAGVPNPKITKFDFGNSKAKFEYQLDFVVDERGQVRHNSLESARMAIHKTLSSLGEENYFFKVRKYPHQVLRENRMMAFAGADRMQQGMRLSFGKPTGLAIRVKKGDVVFSVFVNEQGLSVAKRALKIAQAKFPLPSTIMLKKNMKKDGVNNGNSTDNRQ